MNLSHRLIEFLRIVGFVLLGLLGLPIFLIVVVALGVAWFAEKAMLAAMFFLAICVGPFIRD